METLLQSNRIGVALGIVQGTHCFKEVGLTCGLQDVGACVHMAPCPRHYF